MKIIYLLICLLVLPNIAFGYSESDWYEEYTADSKSLVTPIDGNWAKGSITTAFHTMITDEGYKNADEQNSTVYYYNNDQKHIAYYGGPFDNIAEYTTYEETIFDFPEFYEPGCVTIQKLRIHL